MTTEIDTKKGILTAGQKWIVAAALLVSVMAAGCNSVSVGDTVKLTNGQSVVTVAPDISTFDRLVSSSVAKDYVGFAEAASNSFTVIDGTKALVIDKGPGRVRVRIMEGPQIDEVGWIPSDWAK